MLMATNGGGMGIGLANFAIPCAIYLIFRLVRPFPFTVAGAEPPESPLYWIGTLLVTLVTAASVFFVAWGVSFIGFLRYYRIAGLALPLATVAGFLFVEASIVRSSAIKMRRPPYVDAGLLSALLIPPGLLVWFASLSPRSGLVIFIGKMFTSELWLWLAPVSAAACIVLLWWVTTPLRRTWRRSALYRSLMGAIWVFGVTAFLIFTVFARRGSGYFGGGSDKFTELVTFSTRDPITFIVLVTVVWLVLGTTMYAARRDEAPK
jgi:hypothetical protein